MESFLLVTVESVGNQMGEARKSKTPHRQHKGGVCPPGISVGGGSINTGGKSPHRGDAGG